MKNMRAMFMTFILVLTVATVAPAAFGADLPEVRKAGVLRHLGIPYANFVTGSNDGMDVELVKGFAKYLGVRYEYVKTGWETVVQDLIGKKVTVADNHAVSDGEVPIRGDLIANGFTILPWRQEIIDFSDSTFPSQIWLIARAESSVKPIKPSPKNVAKDIVRVREAMKGKRVLALPNTCLDPRIYALAEAGATVECFTGNLNELAPAVINGKAEMTILDVPDALIALEKWPGKIKIIGPVSPPQTMAVGFPKSSPKLREAFNKYLAEAKRNGKYLELVKKYYPTGQYFFPDFFKRII
jgi:ABC-type amino acid transport substrate-binding protein